MSNTTIVNTRKLSLNITDKKLKKAIDLFFLDRFYGNISKDDFYLELIIRGMQSMGGSSYYDAYREKK